MNPPHVQPSGVDEELATLLYVSEMAALGSDQIQHICMQSRDNNAREGITGLLVFDGQAFCQYVEGAPAAIASLQERLERDPRHTHMRLLQAGPKAEARRHFPNWRLGYAYIADPAAIARIGGLSGGLAIAAFEEVLPSLTDPVDERQ